MIDEALSLISQGKSLAREEAKAVADSLMRGEVGAVRTAALLMGMRSRGETAQEVVGFAEGMQESAVTLELAEGPLADTCGTGGDRKGTFNISTAAAFIAAGAGLRVAKHGNRGVSSRCGSADVLEALGVNIELPPARMKECIEKVGIGFLFAPLYHPAMRNVMGVRKELGVPTIFNLLGPLTNPARPSCQVLGVNSREKVPLIARVLVEMGVERAFVVHGGDGMDELTTTGPNLVCEVDHGEMREYLVDPAELGLPPATLGELRGGEAADNARIIQQVLEGKEGPCLHISLLNAAAVLVAGGLAKSLLEGVEMGRAAVGNGSARKKLEEFARFTREVRD